MPIKKFPTVLFFVILIFRSLLVKLYLCDLINLSRDLRWSLKTSLPFPVMKYFVLGFLSIKDFFTPMNSSFSNVFKWLARLPSVTSRYSFRELKSILSLTANADIIPSLVLFSNALCKPFNDTFTFRTYNSYKCHK